MDAAYIFQWASLIAFIGWLVLLIGPLLHLPTDKFVIGIVVALLCIIYTVLLVQGFQFADFMKFSSLEGIMQLLGNPTAMAAGWVHYLAFDLLTGCWILRNATKLNIPYRWVVPSLLLTFMAGPMGLLIYLLTRSLLRGYYFLPND